MVMLKTLPEVLFKPREFYESMEEVTWKEGVLILLLSLIFSLILYSIFANVLGTSKIIFDFGLGYELTPFSLFFGFGQTIVFLILSSLLANIIALHFGGTGNLSETVGMFGYSGFLAFPKSLASIFLMIFLFSKITSVEFAAGLEQFLSSFMWIISSVFIIFILWELWIKGAAVSVEHDVSHFKGFLSALTAIILTYTIVFSLKYLGGLLA
ncbi:MAG: YIP1 family protein [Candidatus Undinarchaeales archaeon]